MAKVPALDPAIIKRNSIMIPPPNSVPEMKNHLALAIMKLYKSKIPAPPPNAIKMPAPPKEVVVLPKLTTNKAPMAPLGVIKAPPIDPAILKRNSIMIPPPP